MTLLASDRLAASPVGVADERDPVARMSRLFDQATMELLTSADSSGVVTARGRIDGVPTIAYCTDATRMGGALGRRGCQRIADAILLALAEGAPVVGLWHSGGAQLAEGVVALDGVGRVFRAMVQASGRIPHLSVVLGPAAGGGAYGPALTDLVIMAPAGRIFVTGPDVVRSVTGEQADMESLGGPQVHGKHSGVAHVVARDEAAAFAHARTLTALLARPGRPDPDAVRQGGEMDTLLPTDHRRAYDVRPVVRALVDSTPTGAPLFQELQAGWAPNIVVGLGRLGGGTVGVIANNPLRKGGCLDSLSAEKAARFVRMCDAYGIPLAVLVDVPGYLPGLDQERDGVVRRGAKLLHAFAEATVPRVTVVMRKSYGGAYIAMNSRALGADAVFAWPGAQVAVMGAAAAVDILHRRALAAAPAHEREALRERLVAEHERTVGGLHRVVEFGAVDEVIEPAQTPRRVAQALASLPAGRGAHTNIPL
ncbi:acyl-CoA carboxylase subunit beta [Planosporangium thailandense]|uniref:Acyl-CoA carboxylase subunit beta n=1 Tax=Planosporangium thailandense TaxID=765197 RepID=A0ABX0XZ94_9ACTN|nr:carboxyl transferase domain-containing protein [Planosporangium thailandense]NJC70675.1 acyl-CoA carboxylase subunit beta [Planosporangium thailandense]